ncbi:N-acetylmuramoyl-L-alanine amidase family protein [Staphylospora marina]|uniref:N-acetylmuramoyl-L-alanine amidase family protein n=1 Tax=Staphylospora marina TaxID=2490858 RepID=UPI000F5BA1D6|nr:N-acetylmuramoyl-L-alanine amidase [Staphylospora marina]
MLICLDPGHGGSDTGAVGQYLTEKDVCLDLAFRLRRKLLNYEGIRVTMTRSRDADVTPEERGRHANDRNADLFISLHTHFSDRPGRSGFATYVSVIAGSETRRIQCWLHNRVASFLRKYGVCDLGKKNDTETECGQLPELRRARMPAIALASLWLTREREQGILSDEAFLEQYAECIADGIAHIYQCRKREEASV